MKLTYVVVFEQMPSNYSAYAPDVPGLRHSRRPPIPRPR